jgi:hypothetical protein
MPERLRPMHARFAPPDLDGDVVAVNHVVVESDTMSWQILSCGRPKPAAFSTILRSLTVGA